MKLVANIQLKPTDEQAALLKQTLERSNKACNWIAREAHENKTYHQFPLQALVYKRVRRRFSLSAQVTVRCIAKAANAYKTGPRGKLRHFRRHAAQPYDARIFRFCKDDQVSIWCLGGRQKINYVCGERQRELLKHRKGEVDLMSIRGKWYVACVCDIDDPEKLPMKGVLGIDLGIVNLAFDSDGECFSGEGVEQNRRKYAHRRKNLQRKGTKSAKRKLISISGKEARFKKDVNHCISKAIVGKAQRSRCAIALEDLKGIRTRAKARRRQRSRLHSWAFYQLRAFIEYKAVLAGVLVIFVDPAYTSQTCPECGHVSKGNRPSRDKFVCESCGHAGASDHIAARNIRARAVVNQPMADVA